MHEFNEGEVLVADMTDPDWEPIMKRASAIVTNRGGRTCHAAIIARELGIPAVVGTGDGDPGAGRRPRGDGLVRRGRHRPRLRRRCSTSPSSETELDAMPEIPAKIMMNVGTPEQAFAFAQLPQRGRRPGPARVHHQPADRHPPQGAARARPTARGRPLRAEIERDDRGVPRPARVLRPARRRGRLDAGGRVRAVPGDRADERLQVQRVRQPGRRRALRAATRRTR